jgi:hypothetical protein
MRSRFSHPVKWKLPRHRRSTKLWGAESDRGRYLKCWNCGFLVDTQKGLSSSESNGNSYSQTAGTNNSIPTTPTSPLYGHTIQDYQGSFDESAAPGNDKVSIGAITTFVLYSIDTSIGACPLCGTTNLP